MEKTAKEILHERALVLSHPLEKKETEKFKLLVFSLGQEWYGLKLDCAKEVVTVKTITPLPCVASSVKGLMNLRGTIISVTDPKELLGLCESRESESELAIVVEVDGISSALLIESIFGVVDVPVEAVEAPLLTLERAGEEYLLGEIESENKLVGILDPQAILTCAASQTTEAPTRKNF